MIFFTSQNVVKLLNYLIVSKMQFSPVTGKGFYFDFFSFGSNLVEIIRKAFLCPYKALNNCYANIRKSVCFEGIWSIWPFWKNGTRTFFANFFTQKKFEILWYVFRKNIHNFWAIKKYGQKCCRQVMIVSYVF